MWRERARWGGEGRRLRRRTRNNLGMRSVDEDEVETKEGEKQMKKKEE